MHIHHSLNLALAALLWSGSAAAHDLLGNNDAPPPVVTPVMTQALPDQPGKEVLMLTVEYPPGGADPVHRHDAHGFIYVLEGSIVMGVRGGKEVTLTPGQSFHEGPDDVHTVGRNASKDKPAKFLVFLLKDTGKPALVPVP
ncbi:quercetin dioxygenase-like cupin family protein [Lysobacter niabensis]|uniref:Quercetin dioxygenase-like cupin family protein n=1 Tax=Agrilutibacter niabensis TaxID=380628 RepID=A0ABU1VK58_9GAMM|nr:cupin domain-containing protein [Lysobacter niabensis]MDR7097862.1 quercetin dioxygenase-like cupin family protein [Lysobacter niabensis]